MAGKHRSFYLQTSLDTTTCDSLIISFVDDWGIRNSTLLFQFQFHAFYFISQFSPFIFNIW